MNNFSEWQKHYQTRIDSGLSVIEYCRKHSIPKSIWYRAQKQYKSEGNQFTPISIKPKVKSKELSINFELLGDGRLQFSGSTNDSGIVQRLLGGHL